MDVGKPKLMALKVGKPPVGMLARRSTLGEFMSPDWLCAHRREWEGWIRQGKTGTRRGTIRPSEQRGPRQHEVWKQRR